MSDVPYEFRRRLAEHNRTCWTAALFSLFGAAVGWSLLFALFYVGALLVEGLRAGDLILVQPEKWIYWTAAGGALLMLAGTATHRYFKRFQPPPDRPIIGGHVLPEILLLPPRMTLAIWDHINARVTLTPGEVREAWSLLLAIFGRGRADLTKLSMDSPQPEHLARLLLALQLTDWIDLHRGVEDWFYRVRSDEAPVLRRLLPEMEREQD